MTKNKKGRFIVFEGLDGSGQSTQAGKLVNFLREKGIKTHLTKEPTNNLIGGLIRGQLQGDWKSSQECLQLLFAADRAHHLEREVVPYLEKGVTVVSDRYFFSSIAFGSLEIDDWDWLKTINKRFIKPDIVFYLKTSPKTCIKRISENRFSFELFEKEKKLNIIEKTYNRILKEYDFFEAIDGEKSIEDIAHEIKKSINKFF
jgi:dTMP kinase